jgi:hypothetical protein
MNPFADSHPVLFLIGSGVLFLGFVGFGYLLFHEGVNACVVGAWYWLKGSRVSLFLRASDGGLATSFFRMRKAISIPVIELSRGPFRRRSALYGKNSDNWKVAAGHWNVNSVELQDRKGLPVKTVLRLVDRWSSLQALLDDNERVWTDFRNISGLNEEFRKRVAKQADRIAELEAQLKNSEVQRVHFMAAVYAIRRTLIGDRVRHRSKFSEALRKFLDAEEGLKFKNDDVAPAGTLDEYDKALRRLEAVVKSALQRPAVKV